VDEVEQVVDTEERTSVSMCKATTKEKGGGIKIFQPNSI
jgi:hypothetical protein